jgi:LPS export ABC transporter protein LptC
MSKTKIAFIAISLTLVIISIWIYLGQKDGRSNRDSSESQIKAKLVGYELFRYQNDEMKARTTGKKAFLYEHGKMVCEDHVKSVRIRDGIREELESEKADILFADESPLSQKNSTASVIELTGNVEFTRGESTFHTEWIRYTEKTGEAFTDRPVKITSQGQFIAAEGGMTYNIKVDNVKLRGGVVGSLKSELLQDGIKGKSKR